MAGLLWGIYVRISDDRREGAGLGVKRQEKDIRAMIARIDPEGVVVEVYVDNDLSAYSGKPRKDYNRMAADITSGRLTAVGAWHNDRLHRPDLRELEDFIDLIEGNKTRVATVKAGEMDLATPTGRLVARQLGIIARFESEHKADRIRSKHIELAAAGKSTGGGFRPYGYVRIYDRPEQPHKIVREEVVPEEAEVIRECATRLLAGERLYTVVVDLNQRGITTSAGNTWSTSSLARILASARIAGLREHRPRARASTKRVRTGPVTAKGAWPPIITVTQSEALRRLLTSADRKPRQEGFAGRTGRYLCGGGVLFCGKCGKQMTGHSRGAGKASLYVCDGAPGRPGCGRCYIDGTGTDRVVIAWAAGAISDPAFHKALQAREPGRPDESMLLDEIASAERELAEWAKDKSEGRVTRAEWLTGRDAAVARAERARRQLSQDSAGIVLDGVPTAREALEAFLRDTDVPVARRRAVVHVVLKKVIVHPAVKGRHRFDPSRLEPEWAR
jgi:site-specific DNA recombinase